MFIPPLPGGVYHRLNLDSHRHLSRALVRHLSTFDLQADTDSSDAVSGVYLDRRPRDCGAQDVYHRHGGGQSGARQPHHPADRLRPRPRTAGHGDGLRDLPVRRLLRHAHRRHGLHLHRHRHQAVVVKGWNSDG